MMGIRPRVLRRRLLLVGIGGMLAAGSITAGVAKADTVLAAEGLMQRPGKTQTAFGGVFCEHHTCQSVNNPTGLFTAFTNVPRGAAMVAAAVGATKGPVMVIGWSLGAASIERQLREWADNPESAPAVDRVRVVTFGAPEPTGRDRDRAAAIPATAPRYEQLDVVAQYDKIADKPDRWGWYSMINTASSQHFSYFDVDIDDPRHLVYRDGQTTRMLIEADVLPMLKKWDWLLSDERMAELDAKYRPLVERDYDRPDYVPQGAGADWGNGVEPEALRGEAEWDTTTSDVETLSAESVTETAPSSGSGGTTSGRAAARSSHATPDSTGDDTGRPDTTDPGDKPGRDKSGDGGDGSDGSDGSDGGAE
ncbi:SL1278 acyltransferase Chp1 [Mycolicibacterium vanbaalenii]|uniref:SL1278 acyltransferase Chp1 n=1 Tax=Mycolicibacterium vanbaalenii TaxID=110539 RepID=A0A5S9R5Y2_MYCVN|nr:PE-PPE domain-containing protein [Mycolicibacterium vanbaalenii]CAA0129273.1 SL1278 acyltransferase Chp1 [Mycolicibacterium vanbaalenii]